MLLLDRLRRWICAAKFWGGFTGVSQHRARSPLGSLPIENMRTAHKEHCRGLGVIAQSTCRTPVLTSRVNGGGGSVATRYARTTSLRGSGDFALWSGGRLFKFERVGKRNTVHRSGIKSPYRRTHTHGVVFRQALSVLRSASLPETVESRSHMHACI